MTAVPLPGLRTAVQRVPRRGAEPDLPAGDVIAFAVFCRRHVRLVLRDWSGIMGLRGIEVDHKAICDRETRLLPVMGDALDKRRPGTTGRPGNDDERRNVRDRRVVLKRSATVF